MDFMNARRPGGPAPTGAGPAPYGGARVPGQSLGQGAFGASPARGNMQPLPPGAMRPRPPAPAPRPPGAAIGAGAGWGLSDEHSKTAIAKLEGQNEALTKALDTSFNGSNRPATEYPTVPASTRFPAPSRASFADSPAANTVAAQNVGLTQAAPAAPPPVQMPPPPPPQAQGGLPAPRVRPGFTDPGMALPDTSELDAAYRNIGRQQGG